MNIKHVNLIIRIIILLDTCVIWCILYDVNADTIERGFTMFRAHKVRMYPTAEQSIVLAKTVGTARYAYNWALDKWNELRSQGVCTDAYQLSRQWTIERPQWSREVSAAPAHTAIMNLGSAFKAFFANKSKYPRHHKKGVKDNFYINNQKCRIVAPNVLLIERIGRVRLAENIRYLGNKYVSCIISCKAGKWFASLKFELPDTMYKNDPASIVGVDVGCIKWATTSDGTVLEAPQQLKHARRVLVKKQRLMDRKKIGSKRHKKAALAVSKANLRLQNIKLDTLHKFTTAIAKQYNTVVVESLDLEELKASNHISAKGVQNAMIGELLRQLRYKCNNVVCIDMYYPSSKKCSKCGSIKTDLSVNNRKYVCTYCGLHIDRDINAAINILEAGVDIISGGSHR